MSDSEEAKKAKDEETKEKLRLAKEKRIAMRQAYEAENLPELVRDQAAQISAQAAQIDLLRGEMRSLILTSKEEIRTVAEKIGRERVPKRTPMEYDGTGDLEDYLKQFEQIAKAQKRNNEVRAMMLLSSMKGKGLTAISKSPDTTFESYVKSLKKGIHETKEMNAAQRRKRKQKKGETLESLADDIRKLAVLAYGETYVEENDFMVREYFVDAIKDRMVHQKLRDGEPKSLDETLELGKRLTFNQALEDKANAVEEVGAVAVVKEQWRDDFVQ